jgi:hypothetical protein
VVDDDAVAKNRLFSKRQPEANDEDPRCKLRRLQIHCFSNPRALQNQSPQPSNRLPPIELNAETRQAPIKPLQKKDSLRTKVQEKQSGLLEQMT